MVKQQPPLVCVRARRPLISAAHIHTELNNCVAHCVAPQIARGTNPPVFALTSFNDLSKSNNIALKIERTTHNISRFRSFRDDDKTR